MALDTTKIIHAPVGGGRYTVTAPIVKEDYGLYLLIEGLELPSTYEVDFSNSEHNGTSVTMIGNSDGVLIPSQFISSGKDVFAFLYHVGVDFGRTVYKFRIPNKLRPDRANEEPTPEEQSVIDQAINALNNAVEQTAQDVIDADASAQSASADAERAEEARTDAQNYATQAEQSATDASQSASQASASATASAQSAEQSAINSADAQDSAEEAQASASASAQSATASANSASQASASATSASQSASSAQGYASQAQTSAQTASSKASEASTSASTASAKATESAQSASQAQGYANTAEQAKTASQTAQTASESARDSAISAKNDAESARDEAQRIVETYDERLTKIDGLVFPQFELGNIQISSSGWTYANSSLRIRTPQGYTVHLKEGSKISIAEGARFYVGALKSDDTYYDGGTWQTSELILPVEGDYVILVTYLPQVTVTDIDALASMLTVYSVNNALADVEDKIEALEEDHYKPYPTDTASGAIASFVDGADDIPLKSLTVNINPVQDLHGYDSPWVGGGGKNLLDPTLLKDQVGWNNISIKVKPNTQYICFTTDRPSDVGLYIYFNNTNAQGGGSATQVYLGRPVVLTSTEDGYVYISQRNSGEDSFANYHFQVEEGNTATDWTPYENICPISGWTGMQLTRCGKNLFNLADFDSAGWTKVDDAEYPDSYTGRKFNFAHLRGDVSYDPNAIGLLPKRMNLGQVVFTWYDYNTSNWRVYFHYAGDENWTNHSGNIITVGLKKSPSNASKVCDGVALDTTQSVSSTGQIGRLQIEVGSEATDYEPFNGEIIPIDFGQTVYGGKLDVLSGILTVYPYYASYNGETLTGKWISDRDVYAVGTTPTIGAQVVNIGATGTEIQLEPHEVSSLLGQNNIFADTGDCAVEYRADTKLYINRLTEPDADMIADANITSGQYFMVGNNLYKATANIANGGQIVVGTNCTRVSLAQALNEINA